MNLAEYLADFLVAQNVRHVFGLQGGAILKLVDAMVATGKIDYVQNFHEQASAFCADAYARTTDGLGVAFATSGPGATNLVTGIANAQLDSIPTLFITGQEFSRRLAKQPGVRTNGFQDLDIVSVVKPLTKYAVQITDPTRIAYELEKSVYLATSGRPGAVLVDIPIDMQFVELDTAKLEHFTPPVTEAIPPATTQQLQAVTSMLRGAKRPVILAGGGVSLAQARAEFAGFAKQAGIPVALTLNGLDLYPERIGFSGLYGNIPACLAVHRADVLLVLGARLGQHQVGKTQQDFTMAKVIHVDVDPLELGRSLNETLSIQADLKDFLPALTAELKAEPMPDFAPWWVQVRQWQEQHAESVAPPNHGVSPIALIKASVPHLSSHAVVLADVGQNQMWLAQAIELKAEQRLFNSSGLGSMGYALPAAIAAKLLRPDETVVAFMGDGGFQINMQELQLVALRRLGVKLFVFNNGTLGLIKLTQDKHFGQRHHGCAAPDFASVNLELLAKAYDIPHYSMNSHDDFSSLTDVFAADGPALISVDVSPAFPLRTRYDFAPLFEEELVGA
jgi:acetolactate synthase I/II/III large subunit